MGCKMNKLKLGITFFTLLFSCVAFWIFFERDHSKDTEHDVRMFLNKVFTEENKDYFSKKLYSKFSLDNTEFNLQVSAFDDFFRIHGKLVNLLHLEGNESYFRFEEETLLSANYFVVAEFEKIKVVKFNIAFVRENDEWKFYGYSTVK